MEGVNNGSVLVSIFHSIYFLKIFIDSGGKYLSPGRKRQISTNSIVTIKD